jgi:hypothetical protein
MNPNETTCDKQSLSILNKQFVGAHGLAPIKSLLWIASLALLALLVLPNATLAQRSRDERFPDKQVTQTTDPIVLGTNAQTVQIPGTLIVGNGRLQVVNSAIGGGVVTNNLYIRQLNQSAALPHLCWKTAPDGVQALLITTCTTSSSSLRYKTDLQPFLGGLDVINRLKPITFTRKAEGIRDIGLAAEEVEKAEPLLSFRNDKGEIEGVKYELLAVVFINAFKEQQAQLSQQEQQIEVLRKLVLSLRANRRIHKKTAR